jgi:hypothetical protein
MRSGRVAHAAYAGGGVSRTETRGRRSRGSTPRWCWGGRGGDQDGPGDEGRVQRGLH